MVTTSQHAGKGVVIRSVFLGQRLTISDDFRHIDRVRLMDLVFEALHIKEPVPANKTLENFLPFDLVVKLTRKELKNC